MNPCSEGWRRVLARLVPFGLLLAAGAARAHDVTPGDAGYIQEIWGVHIIPFSTSAPNT